MFRHLSASFRFASAAALAGCGCLVAAQPPAPIVVIGAGPAAHSAAVYAARAGLKPVLYEGQIANGVAPGGQLNTTIEVENYLGFPDGVSGQALAASFSQQSSRFGTDIRTHTVTRVDLSSRPFRLWVEGQAESDPPHALASALIIATGAVPRRLQAAGAEAYWQRGVSTCATCDGFFFRNKVVCVVGGGDSACEEALYLAKLCAKVYLVHRRGTLRASSIMAERVLAHPRIEPVWSAAVREVRGDGQRMTGLLLQDTSAAGLPDRELPAAGVFVAIGHTPATEFLGGQLARDAEGYLAVDSAQATSVTGVWAAGDVADHKYRQAIVAAGAGCVAALEAERWLTQQGPAGQ